MDGLNFAPANEMKEFASHYEERRLLKEAKELMDEIYKTANDGRCILLKKNIDQTIITRLKWAGYQVRHDGVTYEIRWS